ncbi:MAG: class I SAM-dependent methyltransferase [Clostridia bacterium]
MRIRCLFLFASLAFAAAALAAGAEETPVLPGHPGKDVIWVPTPPALVEKMLDMAKVGPGDFLMDLGSGDGRIVIAAARRGVPALGVEYTPELVQMARRNAAEAGVSTLATFVQGDMFEADLSKATVFCLFLLPVNLQKLEPKFAAMPPGTRIVNNGYKIPGWQEAETGVAGDCGAWCTAYLYYVPAHVAGKWRFPAGEMTLEQDFETITGTFASSLGTQRVEGKVRGDRIDLLAGLDEFRGRVSGATMRGEASGARGGYWQATREQP